MSIKSKFLKINICAFNHNTLAIEDDKNKGRKGKLGTKDVTYMLKKYEKDIKNLKVVNLELKKKKIRKRS